MNTPFLSLTRLSAHGAIRTCGNYQQQHLQLPSQLLINTLHFPPFFSQVNSPVKISKASALSFQNLFKKCRSSVSRELIKAWFWAMNSFSLAKKCWNTDIFVIPGPSPSIHVAHLPDLIGMLCFSGHKALGAFLCVSTVLHKMGFWPLWSESSCRKHVLSGSSERETLTVLHGKMV